MYCPKCGSKIGEGEKFCRTCGMAANPNNGPEVQPDAQFQPYANPVYAPPPGQYINPNVQRRGSSRNLFIIIGAAAVLVIAGIILFIVLSSPGGPSGIVQKYIDSMNSKNLNSMLSCVDTATVGSITQSQFEQLNENDTRVTLNKIISEKINGDSAEVVIDATVQMKDDSGKTDSNKGEVTFSFKKINGQWKIVDIQG